LPIYYIIIKSTIELINFNTYSITVASSSNDLQITDIAKPWRFLHKNKDTQKMEYTQLKIHLLLNQTMHNADPSPF